MKTVLITGSNRGLGRALLDVFLRERFKIIAHARNGIQNWNYEHGLIITGDLRITYTLDQLAKAARDLDLDILINNAGMYYSGPFEESDYGFKKIIDTNLMVPMLLTKRIWPILRKQNGIVININSIASYQPQKGEIAYAASKYGLRGFSQCLQHNTVTDGVRVININFSAIQTDMTKDRPGQNRMIDPHEAAQLIYDLCLMSKYPSLRITNIDVTRRIY